MGKYFSPDIFSPIAYAIGSQMGLSSQTLFHLRNCPALNSVGFNVLSMTAIGRYSDCTLRCEVSILDSGKQCGSDFVILSNFRATIGIVSPTLLIELVPRLDTGLFDIVPKGTLSKFESKLRLCSF